MVERNLAKVEVGSSSLLSRSIFQRLTFVRSLFYENITKMRTKVARADMTDPFYVELISEFEQLPGMADVIESYKEFKDAG